LAEDLNLFKQLYFFKIMLFLNINQELPELFADIILAFFAPGRKIPFTLGFRGIYSCICISHNRVYSVRLGNLKVISLLAALLP
jgi:hypothetical protein